MTSIEVRLEEIVKRLQQLRKDYVIASPAMRQFIIQGAKLLKDEQKTLEGKLESENSAGNQMTLDS